MLPGDIYRLMADHMSSAVIAALGTTHRICDFPWDALFGDAAFEEVLAVRGDTKFTKLMIGTTVLYNWGEPYPYGWLLAKVESCITEDSRFSTVAQSRLIHNFNVRFYIDSQVVDVPLHEANCAHYHAAFLKRKTARTWFFVESCALGQDEPANKPASRHRTGRPPIQKRGIHADPGTPCGRGRGKASPSALPSQSGGPPMKRKRT